MSNGRAREGDRMNCACGHSVFDHAKVYIVTNSESWRGEGGMFFHSVAGPSFTLSGHCEKCDHGPGQIGASVCHRFREEPTLKEAQDGLNLHMAQSFHDFAKSFQKREYLWGISRSKYPDIAWYRQFDRPPGAGRPEVM